MGRTISYIPLTSSNYRYLFTQQAYLLTLFALEVMQSPLSIWLFSLYLSSQLTVDLDLFHVYGT